MVCDMQSLDVIGQKYNVPIIEDAAELWIIFGNRAGTMGKFGVFLYGTKTLTTGEGGAFVTNDEIMIVY